MEAETVDQAEMALEEGRSPWINNEGGEEIQQYNPENTDSTTNASTNGHQNGHWKEKSGTAKEGAT